MGGALSLNEIVELLAELVSLSESQPVSSVTLRLTARDDIRPGAPVSLRASVAGAEGAQKGTPLP